VAKKEKKKNDTTNTQLEHGDVVLAYNVFVYETWREKRFVVASGNLKP